MVRARIEHRAKTRSPAPLHYGAARHSDSARAGEAPKAARQLDLQTDRKAWPRFYPRSALWDVSALLLAGGLRLAALAKIGLAL